MGKSGGGVVGDEARPERRVDREDLLNLQSPLEPGTALAVAPPGRHGGPAPESLGNVGDSAPAKLAGNCTKRDSAFTQLDHPPTLLPFGSAVKRQQRERCQVTAAGVRVQRMTVGQRILELREGKDISQRDLGELVGVDGGVISRWEQGERKPRAQYLPKLAAALGVSVNYLLTGVRDAQGPLALDVAKLEPHERGELAFILTADDPEAARAWTLGNPARASKSFHGLNAEAYMQGLRFAYAQHLAGVKSERTSVERGTEGPPINERRKRK